MNLEDCFAVTQNVTGKTVIVVDDIFTTGATMEEAAQTLKNAGAVEVYGLAFWAVSKIMDKYNKKLAASV